MKYFVIAKHYDENKKECVNKIVCECDSVSNAVIFRRAYASFYSTPAIIVIEEQLVDVLK